jgi:hypothetical protein
MPTWEDLLGPYVGLAKHFVCSSCLNHIFGGSTGHWGQKLILPKVAPARAVNDGTGHAVVFQCADCASQNKEPVVYPIVHPNGELVNHFNISELQDSPDKKEITRAFGDYDNRETMEEMRKQSQTKKTEPTKEEPKLLVKEGDANYKFSKEEEDLVNEQRKIRANFIAKKIPNGEEDE